MTILILFVASPLCKVHISLHPNVSTTGKELASQIRWPSDEGSPEVVSHDSESLVIWTPPSSLARLAAHDDVFAIHPARDVVDCTLHQREIIGLPPLDDGGLVMKHPRFQGNNETVAIADAGFDNDGRAMNAMLYPGQVLPQHPAFTVPGTDGKVGRIRNGAPSDWHDECHGTHVAGIVASSYVKLDKDSQMPDALFSSMGIAPCASLHIQDRKEKTAIERLDELKEISDYSIAVQNNSWGSDSSPKPEGYMPEGEDLDRALSLERGGSERVNILTIFALGNYGDRLVQDPKGSAKQVNRHASGYATAKNILTVGACWSRRAMLENPQLRNSTGEPPPWDEFGCGESNDPPLEEKDGEPGVMEKAWDFKTGVEKAGDIPLFSNKGPTPEGFLRPHVVAPGVGILSTWCNCENHRRIKANPKKKNARNAHSDPYLGYLSGTSMAAPVVSGLAACIREACAERWKPDPRAASLKAIIINAATSLKGKSFWYLESDTVYRKAPLGPPPDNVQGFGLVSMPRSLAHLGQMDSIKSLTPGPSTDLPYRGILEGEVTSQNLITVPLEFSFYLPPELRQLSVTLVWMDPEGAEIMNQLKLQLKLRVENTVVWTEDPKEPNNYASLFPLTGDATDPSPPTKLGNTQKVIYHVPDEVLQKVTQGKPLKVVMCVFLNAALLKGNKQEFSLAWYAESVTEYAASRLPD